MDTPQAAEAAVNALNNWQPHPNARPMNVKLADGRGAAAQRNPSSVQPLGPGPAFVRAGAPGRTVLSSLPIHFVPWVAVSDSQLATASNVAL